ncbi:MAG: tRNA threonylcarbamoyladenosine dehydratase [Eubacterium sp.]|nr:tRNA threonylcarbamoyladenosine dehydratase [Eubacterium sp.]
MITDDAQSRTRQLLGQEALDKLADSRVAVFGLGGVGGYVAEGLARSGIGALDLIDYDTIAPSNLNRQILALHSTLGAFKTDVAEKRVTDIAPGCRVKKWNLFYLPDTEKLIDFCKYDYVVDAIDNITGKLLIIKNAQEAGIPVISSMGTGNKLDATALQVADLYDTSVCPLARVMRRECRKRGIRSLKVVYSTEKPAVTGTAVPASAAFVPAAAGMILAGQVVRDLTGR